MDGAKEVSTSEFGDELIKTYNLNNEIGVLFTLSKCKTSISIVR